MLNIEPIFEATGSKVVPCGATRPQAVFDVECFENLFMVTFRRLVDDEVQRFEIVGTESKFEMAQIDAMYAVVKKYELISFNGNRYDVLMLRYALSGATAAELRVANDAIIIEKLPAWKFVARFRCPELPYLDHIDLMDIPKGKHGLKTYAGRLHCPTLRTLPFEPGSRLTINQIETLRAYNLDDLEDTVILYRELAERVELRRVLSKDYQRELRSKGDPGIAEEVFRTEYTRATGRRLGAPKVYLSQFKYAVPDFISFRSQTLRRILDELRELPLQLEKGKVKPPALFDAPVKLGYGTYSLGVGGLHSTESAAWHVAGDDYALEDIDMTSYYPYIILNCGFYPEHVGPKMLEIYRSVVDRRVAAKVAGNKSTAETLKIVINSSFGKFADQYSVLHDPRLLPHVTLTGQLSLLMLIEMLEIEKISVISANTDGLTVKYRRSEKAKLDRLVGIWQERVRFQPERVEYLGIFARDVNNYFAVKPGGKVKRKGVFGETTVDKNPQNEICSEAIIRYVCNGTPIEETIRGCSDVRKFLSLRKVEGGASFGGERIGKIIRWYHSSNRNAGQIVYTSNGNRVPNADGVVPLMVLPEGNAVPRDVDFGWYVAEAQDLLVATGLAKKAKEGLWE